MCSLDPRLRYVLTGRGWRQIVRRHQDGTFVILKFPVKLGTVALTGPWCNCLCGGEAPCFARAPNQENACSNKDRSHSAQDERLRRWLCLLQACIDVG